jgi:hypothetical protein
VAEAQESGFMGWVGHGIGRGIKLTHGDLIGGQGVDVAFALPRLDDDRQMT